jgi:hypothetical protein
MVGAVLSLIPWGSGRERPVDPSPAAPPPADPPPADLGWDGGSLVAIGDPVRVEPRDSVEMSQRDGSSADPASVGLTGSEPRAIMIRVEIRGLPHDSPGLDPLVRVDGSDLGRRRLFSWTARPGDRIKVRPAKHPFRYEPAEAVLEMDDRSDTLVARFRATR